MKTIIRIILAAAMLTAGFAIGFPIGQNRGFSTGSEWALMQAEILARESGMFMPVHLEEGMFRVTYKQPSQLHKRAWQLADKQFVADQENLQKCERALTARVTRNAYVTQ